MYKSAMFAELVSCRVLKPIVNELLSKNIDIEKILKKHTTNIDFIDDYYNWTSLELFVDLTNELDISIKDLILSSFSQDIFGADMSAVLRALGSTKPIFNHTEALINYFISQKTIISEKENDNTILIKYLNQDYKIERLAEFISYVLSCIPLLWGAKPFIVSRLESAFKIENTSIPKLFDTNTSINEYSPSLISEIIQSLQQNRKEIELKNKELESKNKELSAMYNKLREKAQKEITNEKMRTLGTLATGIAHEINNPLGSVISNVEYSASELLNLKEEYKPETIKELLEVYDDIKDALYRIKNLVGDINMLAHSSGGDKTNHILEPIVDSAIRILSHKIHNINIKKDFKDNSSEIFCSPPRITQVVLNIMSNAIHAIEENKIENGSINILSYTNNNNVILEISNNGGNVPEDLLSKLDEPFFTTKKPGTGIGLGLAIVKQIIDNHDAKIKFKNKNDNFVVKLEFKEAKSLDLTNNFIS